MHALKNDTQVFYYRYPQKPIAAWPPVYQVFCRKLLCSTVFQLFQTFFSIPCLGQLIQTFRAHIFKKFFNFFLTCTAFSNKTIWKPVMFSLFSLYFVFREQPLKSSS